MFELDHHYLAQLLALAGLIAATIEYGHIRRRRLERRSNEVSRLMAESGLNGLVRVFLADR